MSASSVPWVLSSASSASDGAAIFAIKFRLEGAVREVLASRAFHTLLVYTSGCAQAENNLGNPAGDHSELGLSPFEPASINASKIV